MKNFRKLVFVLTLIATLILSLTFICNASADITELGVLFEVNDRQVRVAFQKINGSYYLFLPSDAPTEALVLDYNLSEDVYVEGKYVSSGDTVSFNANGEYVITCGSIEESLSVFVSESLASVHITTESGSLDAVHADKSHKEDADIVIIDESEIVVDTELSYIKGRGNATWTYAKKPYNIKFDKKTSLFGMDKAKKWTLLANYTDKTMLRNTVAFELAEAAGIEYTSECVFVDLYINEEYYGNYLLCESVEVGDGRVEITDLEGETEDVNEEDLDSYPLGGAQESNYRKLQAGTQKWVDIPNDPQNITGGYLLEYELPNRYVNEVSGFVTDRKQTVVLKEPEYASQAQVEYISSYYQEFEDAVFSEDGYNAAGKHYTEYIDVESFVKMYVFQEFTRNLDAAITSFYICKDVDSNLFKAAPVWDFDKALGNSEARFGSNICYPTGWWAGVIYYLGNYTIDGTEEPTILSALYKHNDFFELAGNYWNGEFSQHISQEFLDSVAESAKALTSSAAMNYVRWNYYSVKDYESAEAAYTVEVSEKLIDFMAKRKAFLDDGFSSTTVRIFFDGNGAKGQMYNDKIFKIGDTVTLPDCTFSYPGMVFDGWSTFADGSTVKWQPGDSIPLTSEKVTFYSLWTAEPKPAPDVPEVPTDDSCDHLCHKSGIMGFLWKIVQLFSKLFKVNPVCECGVAHY